MTGNEPVLDARADDDQFDLTLRPRLLSEYVGQEQAVALEKGDFRVVELEASFLLVGHGLQGPVEQVELAAYFFEHRLEAAGANHLEAGMEFAEDADLALDRFGGGVHLERIDLAIEPAIALSPLAAIPSWDGARRARQARSESMLGLTVDGASQRHAKTLILANVLLRDNRHRSQKAG